MARIVQKFGGTSVGTLERIGEAAERAKAEHAAGNEVVVVVSAMSGETNRLIELCRAISPLHDLREYDVVVSSGEQVTSGLLAMALQERGVPARSWLGWQVPIETNDVHGRARIVQIDRKHLDERLARGEICVVPGFQGVSPDGRATTL
ncbi:MAG: aspartate kinase, partial [Pseudomonadota bacterium]